MARTDPQVNLRMPADLKDRLDAAALANQRSLTAEVIRRLDESFEPERSGGIERLEEAMEALRRSVEEGRRHFEEVEKPTIEEALMTGKILRFIAVNGLDDEMHAMLKEIVADEGDGRQERLNNLLAGRTSAEMKSSVEDTLRATRSAFRPRPPADE